jgi:Domain of unknown function (DUF5916)/Carbohydrate family 9 binding domain-like
MNTTKVLAASLLLACAPLARAANWPDRPTLRAVRATSSPVIDGDLSDAAWQAAPEFTDFTQHDPKDGEPATLKTSFRVVYDDDAIYFGAMMSDTNHPTADLARRDSFGDYDFLSINIDSQQDRLSGAAFTVTPSNMQVDSILYNDINEDNSWDGVWESVGKVVPGGWVAELRIPFSQLRFPDKDVHTWGINVTRRTTRLNEWVRIVNTKKGETGFVSHFADLVGLEGIRRGRPLELVPYAVARSDVRSGFDDTNPFFNPMQQRNDAGLDVKYALTSNLTLTGTINPDFGQVEVDPAVVNLSEFETFYPEKRPFFTEGLNIFRFADSPARAHFNFFFPPSQFYSRRIGRSPQGFITNADFTATPAETTILGAAKVTGKVGSWSIGVLDALTDAERGLFIAGTDSGRQQVEPMTNYFVSRTTKEIGANSRVGFLLTSVNRRVPDELSSLRSDAVTAGVDGYTSFNKQSWVFEWAATGTRVSGSDEAMALTQTGSARYYQRPDAEHVDFDPTRSSLTGWGSKLMLSKNTGKWRPNVQLQSYSPGYETNDAGFMQRSDIISGHALMMYVNEDVTKRFRERQVWFGAWNNRNFDNDSLETGFFADHFGVLTNYWDYRAALFVTTPGTSDRLSRGGPLVRTPASYSWDFGVASDSRKRFSFGVNAEWDHVDDGSYYRGASVRLTAKPMSNVGVSITPSYTRSYDYSQYVTAFDDASATRTFGQRYVFAELDRRSFELATRIDWILHSRLSFQLYLQPFVASGDYHDYHALAAARTRDYTPIAAPGPDPDFNFRSVRGSAVMRWEFRPGSALYVVWSENRADVAPVGDFSLNRDFRAIPNAPSHDVFLVKLSYWLPI